MTVWMYALVDVPRSSWDVACRFWSEVTGWPVSDPTREREEFPVLRPPSGDAWLVLQAVDGPPGVHPDLASTDRDRAVDASYAAGAAPVRAAADLVVVRSPGGLAHCHLTAPPGADPVMVRPTESGAVVLDQVCLDIPAPLWDAEVAYWQQVTGRRLEAGRRPEFATLHPEDPAGGLRLLLQRLDAAEGPVRAHLDLAVGDRPTETARHVALGSVVRAVLDWWTVLDSPDGQVYCLTDRDPATGRVLTRRS